MAATPQNSDLNFAAVILAAGKGTRLKSELPKVLHEVCGRPMLAYVFDACRAAGVRNCLTIVGHGKDLVTSAFTHDDGDLTWIEQNPQLGTGHAVMVARDALTAYDHALVLCGDGPLIRTETIRQLINQHLRDNNAATLATAVLDDPTGYGRIWRDPDGNFRGIVEHADCTPAQREIREVNPSYYCFKVPELHSALDRITNDNAKGEYYLTDTFALLLADGHRVGAITSVRPADIYSINSRKDLARVNQVMHNRILDQLMDRGVTIVDPATTWIDARARIAPDTTIEPLVTITAAVNIGRNCRVTAHTHLTTPDTFADGTTISRPAAANPGGTA